MIAPRSERQPSPRTRAHVQPGLRRPPHRPHFAESDVVRPPLKPLPYMSHSSNPMRVEKDAEYVFVILQDQTRIRGYVHRPRSGRLSDLLNYHATDRPFLAITDAAIQLPDGKRYKVPFLTLNRLAITTCFPVPESEE